ncbi:MAG: 50S ribosomal protein L5 [Thermoplasmata archaeon]|nr:MAG: 50S ribosomal protein L5 [Thermoplasmata archaeon]
MTDDEKVVDWDSENSTKAEVKPDSGESDTVTSPAKPKPAVKKPKEYKTHPMRKVMIEKVVVNIGVGEAGEKLRKAERVLEMITHSKPVQTISTTTNKELGIRKQMPIGCKVTLRKESANKFLEQAFWVKDNKLAFYSFDDFGNFSFGIPDYTEMQGMKYDPEIGIFGMDISVSLTRPGLRISKRRRNKKKIPPRHRVTEEEAKEFIKKQFKIEVVEE